MIINRGHKNDHYLINFSSYCFMGKFSIIVWISLWYGNCGKNSFIYLFIYLFWMSMCSLCIKDISINSYLYESKQYYSIIYFTCIHRLGRYQFTKSQTYFSVEHFSDTQIADQLLNWKQVWQILYNILLTICPPLSMNI